MHNKKHYTVNTVQKKKTEAKTILLNDYNNKYSKYQDVIKTSRVTRRVLHVIKTVYPSGKPEVISGI
jgi:Na+-translocating ferredoxin:NAD+ oxidoreductase RnfC subunit